MPVLCLLSLISWNSSKQLGMVSPELLNPIERTSQAQWVTMSLLRLLQFRLEASGKVSWWFRPPWNKKKDRPSVLDAERLMRRHREQIQRLLSKWARNEGNIEGDAA